MSNLVIMKDQQAVTTSLQVAENFDKQHNDTLKAIRSLQEDVGNFSQMFFETNIPDSYGRDRTGYFMNRDGFMLLAMGFTGKKALEFKLKYIEAFNQMEKHIKETQFPINNTKLLLRASLEHEEKIEALTVDVDMLKERMRIDGTEEFQIKEAGNKQVLKTLGGYESNAYRKFAKKAYARFWRDFKKYFTIPRYGELPKSRFDEAIDFIGEWLPDTEMRLMIKQANSQTKLEV